MPKASTFALRTSTQMIDSDWFPMGTNAGENVRLPVSEARALVGPGWSDTVNAYNEDEPTDELKVQAGINRCVSTGKTILFIPTSMLPFDASLITFDNDIQLVREGGSFDYYDVRAYGAAGDGIIDDTASFTAATATNAPGAIIYVPPGTFKHSGDVVLKSGQTLMGAGWASILKHTSGDMTDGAVSAKGTVGLFHEQCRVRDLKIEGTGSVSGTFDPTDKGVFMEYANNMHVTRVWVDQINGEAIYGQTDGSYLWWIDNLVTDSAFNAMNTNGALHSVIMRGNVAIDIGNELFEGSGSEFQLIDNTVIGFGSNGIACGQGAHGIIRGNFITGGTNSASPAIQCQNAENMVIIDANIIWDNAGRAIVTGGGTGTTDRILVTNNQVVNNGGPEQIVIGSEKTLVTGNHVIKTSGAATHGIYVDSNSTSIGADKTVIEGNLSVGHSTADISRTALTDCVFGRNTVTSREFEGDRMVSQALDFTRLDFSTDGRASEEYRIPYAFDIVGITSDHDPITAGTLRILPFRNGSANSTVKIDESSISNASGGSDLTRWGTHAAGDRLSAGIANAASVTPTATPAYIMLYLELYVTEPNILI